MPVSLSGKVIIKEPYCMSTSESIVTQILLMYVTKVKCLIEITFQTTNHLAYITNDGKGLNKHSLVGIKRIRKQLKIVENR